MPRMAKLLGEQRCPQIKQIKSASIFGCLKELFAIFACLVYLIKYIKRMTNRLYHQRRHLLLDTNP